MLQKFREINSYCNWFSKCEFIFSWNHITSRAVIHLCFAKFQKISSNWFLTLILRKMHCLRFDFTKIFVKSVSFLFLFNFTRFHEKNPSRILSKQVSIYGFTKKITYILFLPTISRKKTTYRNVIISLVETNILRFREFFKKH